MIEEESSPVYTVTRKRIYPVKDQPQESDGVTRLIQLLRLARPHFLFASMILFLMGSLWGSLLGDAFSITRILLGYLAIVPAQLSVSFSNDYFDTAVDALGSPTIFSGGSGVLVKHPELRPTSRLIAITLILISLALAGFFWRAIQLPAGFVATVAVCNFIGWFYAAPPLQLAYRGWGEIAITIIASLLAAMGYLINHGKLDLDGLLLIPPVVLFGLAFSLMVEIPDVEADRSGRKLTWLVRMGREVGFLSAAGCFFLASGYFALLPQIYKQQLPINPAVLAGISLFPFTLSGISAFVRPLERNKATQFANGVVFSLALCLLLIDGYFIFILTSH